MQDHVSRVPTLVDGGRGGVGEGMIEGCELVCHPLLSCGDRGCLCGVCGELHCQQGWTSICHEVCAALGGGGSAVCDGLCIVSSIG